MSRKVDYANPSEADRAWASQFQVHGDQIKMADAARELEESVSSDNDGLADKPDYSRLKKSELVSEITRRNTEDELDPPLSTHGSVADLIAVLEKDDQDAAASRGE